jgi:hypothetical protein
MKNAWLINSSNKNKRNSCNRYLKFASRLGKDRSLPNRGSVLISKPKISAKLALNNSLCYKKSKSILI